MSKESKRHSKDKQTLKSQKLAETKTGMDKFSEYIDYITFDLPPGPPLFP